MTDTRLKLRLANVEGEVHKIKNHSDRLFGHMLGLAACLAASKDFEFLENEAISRLPALAGTDPIPKDLKEYAKNTIRQVLRAQSQQTEESF